MDERDDEPPETKTAAADGHGRARATMDPARLAEVERRYLSGQPTPRIERECARLWGRSRRTVRRYLKVVRARCAAAYAAQTPDEHRARIDAMLVGAYEAAAAGSPKFGPDAKAMVQAARTLAEVAGAIGPRTIEVTGKDGGAVQTESRVVVVLPALEADDAAAASTGDERDEPVAD
jgi:hypothetical protein